MAPGIVFLNIPIDSALRAALKARAALAGKTMTEHVISLIQRDVTKNSLKSTGARSTVGDIRSTP